MGAKSRRKGAAFERAVAAMLATVWPRAKRGLGQARSGAEAADVEGTPYFVQAKYYAKGVNVHAAFAQAEADADAEAFRSEGAAGIPQGQLRRREALVVSKVDRGPVLVTMRVEEFLSLRLFAEHGTENPILAGLRRAA